MNQPRRDSNSGRFGRIPVSKVAPVIENGSYPVKATVDEALPITARVTREGHDKVGAQVVLTDPDGVEHVVDMTQVWPQGLDIWQAWVRPNQIGDWSFRVEGYSDDWHTWQHNAQIKFAIGSDVELLCLEGRQLVSEAIAHATKTNDHDATDRLNGVLSQLTPTTGGTALAALATDPQLDADMVSHARRSLVSPTGEFGIVVERKRALFGSWYEFFPRSQGAHQNPDGTWTSGTLKNSHAMLERIAKLGFDVAYLTPIHPIGHTLRKGPNNSLTAGPNDPGSPWAIGNQDGGHDAIGPDLGTLDDFDELVAKAKSLGLEVAIDFALQASPDHPWVSQHPEWFTTRLDGTIAYAENPPKKYQDIYPINFDNDPEGIYAEVLRLVNFWIGHGVTIFRVDNPHTKPLNFWDWLLTQIHQTHPEVIFLAEAFSRPEIMGNLGRVGFQQSYTYFTWRTTKKELGSYLEEVATQTIDYMRPNFFVNTPDINPLQVRSGEPAAFALRMILAATMSPSWGIYSGYEILEYEPLTPGGEEYADSEKYQYKVRDLDQEPNLNLLMSRLNQIRRQHPALQQLRQTVVLETSSDELFAFAKWDGHDRVIVVVSLNPFAGVEGEVVVDRSALGIPTDHLMGVHDELTGGNFVWEERNYVRLSPANPAHILNIF